MKTNVSNPDQPEEIAAMKSRLLAHITHEFLTPLNLIITPLEQLLAKDTIGEEKKTLAMMHRNSQRLLLIISQVLELLKLDARRLKLKASPQNLIPFLKGITASFELLAEQKEVALTVQSEREDVPLYFDANKMAEVVCNLVMNALRYTPPGGQITISVRELPDDWLEIATHHSGDEIPAGQTMHIFDRFYQLSERFEHHIKGLGIGLFLAREYIKLHHGFIEVESGEGEGTQFVIRLPKGKAHLKPDQIEERPRASAAEETGTKISQRYAFMVRLEREEMDANRPDTAAIPTDEEEAQERDVVLVVEDNIDMRGFIKIFLAEEGFTVVEATDGRQGIEMAKAIIPDIVISDIMMPDVDGYRLCRELKQDIKTSHVPVILLSVKFTEEDIVRGLECGADDYITKPFSTDILLTRVRNLVKQRRRLQERVQWDTVTHPAELGISSLDKTLLKKIQEVIETNLADPEFGIDDLADAFDMSRSSIQRKVKALTGQSPNNFIQSYRLMRSLDLLKSHEGNVTEVAFSVGFSSPAYFTRCFKEKFRRLPSDFHTF